MLNRRKAASI